MKKIIYDVGANNGDDIPYYLLKADLVVAIEANPALCGEIRGRFATEIKAGRVVVESCVVTAEENMGEVDFYVSNVSHVLSQFPAPQPECSHQFTRVSLPSKSIRSVIEFHGPPFYVKIDIEHYDAPLLRALFANGIRPVYVSAESHNIEVFSLLVCQGNYGAFKLVDGSTVYLVYSNCMIRSEADGQLIPYSFPGHSAGPFGEDVNGEWMAPGNFLKLLALEGLGWKDIHATNALTADPSVQPKVSKYLDQLLRKDEMLSYLDRAMDDRQLLSYLFRRMRAWLTKLF